MSNDLRTVFLDVEEHDRAEVVTRYPQTTFVDAKLRDAELIKACLEATVISTFITTPFPRSVIEKLPNLKLICTRSVGFDHIDIAACRERGITVCNVPDYGSHVIAEHVFALLLSTLRHINEAHKRVTQGNFDYHGLRGMALRGKTLGIVGTGKIGRRVAHIAYGFGMNIIASDQCRTLFLEEKLGVQYVTLPQLLAQSDIVTLHVPGATDGSHLIDAKAFAMMKRGVTLVNTARGSLIDSRALLDAVKNGTVAHALLDVIEHEDHLQKSQELVAHPNVVTTPHIAFYADDSMNSMYADCFASIEQWQSGKTPEHQVQPVAVVCDIPHALQK